MPKLKPSILIILIFFYFSSFGQKKILQTKSTLENITIDGKNNEEAWKSAPIATDFVMFEPDNGKPISETKKTEVKLLYDNTAIYILAELHDNQPNRISKELTNRDVFGISDHFSVSINGFNDGQQDYRFYVSAAGVQMDCLATENNEDFSWDAIWNSEVTITNYGWVVEMKIPYAALRFSKAEKQTWGLNFTREIKRDFQKYTWNHVDNKIGAIITQEGILEGIKNIDTPTRLFLIPYTSGYYQQDKITSDKTFKAGMDIKYGINDSFTLDAILIPDFGQTKFDNAILNLEPFEQQLNENRPFFTEATDLFSKGGLFYSRRIGGTPSKNSILLEEELNPNEEITNFPNTVDLINAVKVSGRTEKGLGIGILNAVTEKTFATITNTTTNTSRKEVVEPLTSYNVLVLDQRFNQNSSVSFVNTNTLRNGDFRDANVSAILFNLNTKANTYNLFGDFKNSYINDIEDYSGYKAAINFAKTSGKYRYLFATKYISKNYDINDLGIIFYNNYHSFYGENSYRILKSNKTFNTLNITQNINTDIDNTTGKIQEAWYQLTTKGTTVKNHYFEFFTQINPLNRYDFYEPRIYGRFVYIPKSIIFYGQFYSDETRPFHYELELSTEQFDEQNRNIYRIYGGLKYRFNDKFSLSNNFLYTRMTNDRGWIDFDNTDIIFGQRNREIFENYFTGKYAITNKMNFNLTARYYWSYSENNKYLTLQNNGHLNPNSIYAENKNRNFNSWNLDFSYSWWFAPGSELAILYRNYAVEDSDLVQKNSQKNLDNLFKSNLTNILSVSLRYYIDYNSIKRKH